jgi:predicted MFS family arabinose efflux permease
MIGLMAAEFISSAGTSMTWLAIPWFVLLTTGSVAKMSLVYGVEVAPTILLGIPSGAIVQRFGARRTMLGCDLARAPLLAALPLLNASGGLSFPLLLVIVAAAGAFTSPYLACQRVVLPEIVGNEQGPVGQANTVVEAASNLGGLLGPAAGGLLIAAFGAMPVVWSDAGSYLAAFLVVLVGVRSRYEGPSAEEVERGIFAGVRHIVRDPVLRPVAVVVLLSGLWFPVLVVALPVLAFDHGADPRVAGWLFASLSGGTLLGSVISYRALARWPATTVGRFAIVWVAGSLCLLILPLPIAAVAAVLATASLLVPSANAPAFTLLTLAPEAVRAKVTTAVLTVNTAFMPLGYLIAGLVIAGYGLRAAFVVVALGATITAVLFVRVTLRVEGSRAFSDE